LLQSFLRNALGLGDELEAVVSQAGIVERDGCIHELGGNRGKLPLTFRILKQRLWDVGEAEGRFSAANTFDIDHQALQAKVLCGFVPVETRFVGPDDRFQSKALKQGLCLRILHGLDRNAQAVGFGKQAGRDGWDRRRQCRFELAECGHTDVRNIDLKAFKFVGKRPWCEGACNFQRVVFAVGWVGHQFADDFLDGSILGKLDVTDGSPVQFGGYALRQIWRIETDQHHFTDTVRADIGHRHFLDLDRRVETRTKRKDHGHAADARIGKAEGPVELEHIGDQLLRTWYFLVEELIEQRKNVVVAFDDRCLVEGCLFSLDLQCNTRGNFLAGLVIDRRSGPDQGLFLAGFSNGRVKEIDHTFDVDVAIDGFSLARRLCKYLPRRRIKRPEILGHPVY